MVSCLRVKESYVLRSCGLAVKSQKSKVKSRRFTVLRLKISDFRSTNVYIFKFSNFQIILLRLFYCSFVLYALRFTLYALRSPLYAHLSYLTSPSSSPLVVFRTLLYHSLSLLASVYSLCQKAMRPTLFFLPYQQAATAYQA